MELVANVSWLCHDGLQVASAPTVFHFYNFILKKISSSTSIRHGITKLYLPLFSDTNLKSHNLIKIVKPKISSLLCITILTYILVGLYHKRRNIFLFSTTAGCLLLIIYFHVDRLKPLVLSFPLLLGCLCMINFFITLIKPLIFPFPVQWDVQDKDIIILLILIKHRISSLQWIQFQLKVNIVKKDPQDKSIIVINNS